MLYIVAPHKKALLYIKCVDQWQAHTKCYLYIYILATLLLLLSEHTDDLCQQRSI